MNLLDGDFTGKSLQVGALSGQVISVSIKSMKASAPVSYTHLDVYKRQG